MSDESDFDDDGEELFAADPSDLFPTVQEQQRQRAEEGQDDEEDIDLDEDFDEGNLEDLGLFKGIWVYIKYLRGKDVGAYEALMGDADASDVTQSEQHKDLVAPADADFSKTRMAKIGTDYTISAFTEQMRSEPQDLFLREVFGRPDVRSDITVHMRPYDDTEAVQFLKQQVDNLRAEYVMNSEEVGSSKQERRFAAARDMLDRVQNSQKRLYDVSMYETVRGKSPGEVKSDWKSLKYELEKGPAHTQQVVASYVQDKALKTTSPIAKDYMGYTRQMLSGAAGAMFPMASTSVVEKGGVYFGLHGYNGSPVIVNRFQRDGGFNQLTVGSIGAGKSFSSKLQVLQTYAAMRDDLVVVIMDPLDSFQGFTQTLGGSRIRVGGSKGINPMEIRAPESKEIAEQLKQEEGTDPFREVLNNVSNFFVGFCNQEGFELGERRPTLERAIQYTYNRCGITSDIDTHSKESPTIADPDSPATLFETLEDMADDPGKYANSTLVPDEDNTDIVTEQDQIRQHAYELLNALSAFHPGGKYDMLGTKTDIDIMQNDLVLLDMQSNEMNEENGLMMGLLFNAVYERAKETDKKVLFVIDEAHVMMQDEQTLKILSRAVRHSRHFNLSINFITQQVEDFFKEDMAKAIADNCTIKVVLRLADISERAADGLGLNEQQVDNVKQLRTGKSEGATLMGMKFSQALLYLDTVEWVPINVVPSQVGFEIADLEGEAIDNKERFAQELSYHDDTLLDTS
jgi:hypothetical protein